MSIQPKVEPITAPQAVVMETMMVNECRVPKLAPTVMRRKAMFC